MADPTFSAGQAVRVYETAFLAADARYHGANHPYRSATCLGPKMVGDPEDRTGTVQIS